MGLGDMTGAGKVISGSTETGSYQFVQVSTDQDGENSRSMQTTVSFTEVRETLKWYAVTKASIVTYIGAHADANVNYDLINDKSTDGYDVTVDTVTREIVSSVTIEVPE